MVKKSIPKKVKRSIDAYLDILKTKRIPVKRVFLFGSHAKGRQRRGSDIDLCIISPKFKNPFLAMQRLWLLKDNDKTVDIEPVGFSPEDFRENSPLVWEIKKTGIEIKVPSSLK